MSVFFCREHETIAECAATMRHRNVGFLPVVDHDQRVVGVITDRDLAVRVLGEGRPPETPVSDVMTRELVSCQPDDELSLAEEKMVETRKSRVVVVDGDGRCVGVISLTDIARAESRRRAGEMLQAVTRERS